MRSFANLGLAMLVLTMGLKSASGSAYADNWPSHPVKVVVSFGAGGTADVLGRIIAAELSKTFKQQFYVQNKPGDSGATGSSEVASAAPNGYTLLIAGAGPQLVGPVVNSNIRYQTMRDFTQIAIIAGDTYMLAASPTLGVHNFSEFMKLAQTESITCGSPGAGTQGELLQEIMNKTMKLKLQPIPFRSAADAVTSLLGNHIQAAMQPSISLGEYVKAGKIIGLAVTSRERLEAYKDVPTLKELGHDIQGGTSWFWLAGPSKMPPDIVDKLNLAVRQIVMSAKVQAQFTKSALLTVSYDAAQTKIFIANQVKEWKQEADGSGMKVQ